ncbi:MAG: lysine--tRNA ligase [Candidatus Nanoarchaeia archaeon]|nr:lysine--tRNA ligase [Candidatus Nanoarchaeia archaeon]MDD5357591.1 lysine--tRNA ligase [Candidatus Nanoarchaeia archaeon]MDD5588510.1 lysine--tRNA ligase [Candidatus Nanoarchaeia archaeon]
MGREGQIIAERLRKIEELKKEGVNPYPNKFEKKNSVSECLKSKIGAKVKTAGRLMTKRELGKIAFAKLRDATGEIQIVFQDERTPEKMFSFFKKYIDAGDFAGVEGEIIKTKTGEISVLVKKIELLSKAILPLPEKWHGLQDKEERYRKRYLDLVMNPEVKKIFEKREIVVDTIREFLKKKDFVEVETPVLQSVYGGASATPFITHLNALDMNLFLAISPELYLKRLVVGGFDRVFTICKNFRNEGIDKAHNPEFTMLEFYCAYANYEELMKMTEELIKELFKKLRLSDSFEYQGTKLNFRTIKRMKFQELIKDKTGIDIEKADDFDKLKKEIEKKKIGEVNIKHAKHYGALLDELYKRVVRPNIIQPVFLTNYPVEMIALAKRNEKNPRFINTFQLIVNGAEIIKAYDELNDPIDQENRLVEQVKLKQKGDTEAMPMDEDFLAALKTGMPPTAGFGLGIDRLVMLLTNQPSIRDVILFPFMKPEE